MTGIYYLAEAFDCGVIIKTWLARAALCTFMGFVELKNARLGENTQVPHLAYLGDTEAGANCNFGCGVTTANFDRVQKHETVVGEGAFIGCNTALIAPLQVGSGAYIGAGSTITEDVPAQALGIARARQSNKKEWAAKHKK